MQQAPPHPTPGRVLPLAMLVWALPGLTQPALAASPQDVVGPWLHAALLVVMALGVTAALTLAALAYRRSLRPPVAPMPAFTREELEEMRRAVSAFANLLRDGSAVLIQSHRGTLETVHRVAAHSEQLIALVAGSEARLTNATERSEILATRVARSAATEIRAAVQQLTAASVRIEQLARARADTHSPG